MAPGSPRSKGTDNRSVLGPESVRVLEERLAGTVSGQDWNDAFWRDAILRHVRGVKNQMRRLLKHCPRATCGLCARLRYVLAIFPMIASLSPCLHATIAPVTLNASPASPQLLGTAIQLTASASDSDPGPLTYKWEVQAPGSSSFSLMRDFDLDTTFAWTPNHVEGTYRLRLTARDYLAGTSAQQVVAFRVNALVTGTQPVVIPTANPLVALFSAPACPAGSTNFYMAGMAASQTYVMTYRVNKGGTVTPGPPVSFTTGVIPTSLSFPALSVPLAPGPQTDNAEQVVLTGYIVPPDFPTATDLSANIIWYYPQTIELTRPVPGGTMLAIFNGQGTGTGVWGPNVEREQIL